MSYFIHKDHGILPCNPEAHRLPTGQRIALEALISIAHEAAEVEPEGSGEAGIFGRLEIIEARVRALFSMPKNEEEQVDEP